MPRRPKSRDFGQQGVHREVESEGLAEKYRAIADGAILR